MLLKKKYLTLFYKTLVDAKTDVEKNHISLADARIRDSLATKVVFDLLKDFEEARKKIYDEMAVKDENGKPVIANGNYVFSKTDTPTEQELANVKQMAEEVKILEEEEVEIKIANPDKIKLLVNNTKYEPQVGETIVIDELLALIA